MFQENSNLEVTQRTEFSCCYLDKLDGGKYRLNAYQYKLEATILNQSPFIFDFKTFKQLLDDASPNGQFLYNTEDHNQSLIAIAFKSCDIECYPVEGDISAEFILNELSEIISLILEREYPNIVLKETRLRETLNSYVTWKNIK